VSNTVGSWLSSSSLLRIVRQALSRRMPRWSSSAAFETVEEGEGLLLIAEHLLREVQEEVEEEVAAVLLNELSMETDQWSMACAPIVEVLAADQNLPAIADTYSLHLPKCANVPMYYRSRDSPK
jgi:hypothetical protein